MATCVDKVGLQVYKNRPGGGTLRVNGHMSVSRSVGEGCNTNNCLKYKHCLIAGVKKTECNSVHSVLRQVSR